MRAKIKELQEVSEGGVRQPSHSVVVTGLHESQMPAQQRYADAAAGWNEAADVRRGCNHHDRPCSTLERLSAVYRAGHKTAEPHVCEAHLKAMRAGAPLVRKNPPPKAAPKEAPPKESA